LETVAGTDEGVSTPFHSTAGALRFGAPVDQAQGAIILLHGRGASAQDIAGLSQIFHEYKFAFIAPSATSGAWYPQRFFVPLAENEPQLSSALDLVGQLVDEIQTAGVHAGRIGIVGFSQGACLALEYAARNPRRYGLIGGLSGALIGPADTIRRSGNLAGTPVLLGCAESDPHIPRPFVEQSAEILSRFEAEVKLSIFAGSAHTVFPEEIEWLTDQAARLGAD
jgi:phospholipase/carboxylesterase